MNRGWIEQNRETAEKFMLALVQANDLIGQDRPAAAKMVAKFLKMPLELAVELMPKVEFDMTWTDRAVATIKVAEDQLASQKKLKAPLDYTKYVYTDLLKKVRPENVKITQLPK
jgi:ABC-type nitrate/sulfonate/bicarbonate transport system substrate-binding protein